MKLLLICCNKGFVSDICIYIYIYIYVCIYVYNYVFMYYQRTSQKILNKKIKDLWTDYDNGLKPWGLVKRATHICDPYIPPDVQRDITNEIAL